MANRQPHRVVFVWKRRATQITIRGSRILRVDLSIATATAGTDYTLGLVRGGAIDVNRPPEYLALTGPELGAKTDEYSSRWPSITLDYTDIVDDSGIVGLPTETEVCILALVQGTTGLYVAPQVLADFKVWYRAVEKD